LAGIRRSVIEILISREPLLVEDPNAISGAMIFLLDPNNEARDAYDMGRPYELFENLMVRQEAAYAELELSRLGLRSALSGIHFPAPEAMVEINAENYLEQSFSVELLHRYLAVLDAQELLLMNLNLELSVAREHDDRDLIFWLEQEVARLERLYDNEFRPEPQMTEDRLLELFERSNLAVWEAAGLFDAEIGVGEVSEIRRLMLQEDLRSSLELSVSALLLQRQLYFEAFAYGECTSEDSRRSFERLDIADEQLHENYDLASFVCETAAADQPMAIEEIDRAVEASLVIYLEAQGNGLRHAGLQNPARHSRFLSVMSDSVRTQLSGWSRVNNQQVEEAVRQVLLRADETQSSRERQAWAELAETERVHIRSRLGSRRSSEGAFFNRLTSSIHDLRRIGR
jgi:hypothetical protein